MESLTIENSNLKSIQVEITANFKKLKLLVLR